MNVRMVVAVVFSLLLSACAAFVPGPVGEDESFVVQVFEDGRSLRESVIFPGSERHARWMAWIDANQTGWRRTYKTYAPNFLVKGDRCTFNFSGGVVVNCAEGQFEKEVPESEYQFLMQ